jgi:glycosyltransferase involved in cell wall biosynthesis
MERQVAATERTDPVMFVSIVMCTRNRPDLIGQAVESVLENDWPDFELVVVDQSTDERTRSVVTGMMPRHANLRYVYTEKAGLSRAYNIGIRASSGEVLGFTDDDCVAPPDWVRSIAGVFTAEPGVDMLYGQVLLPAALRGHDGEVPTLPIYQPELIDRANGFRVYGMGANFAVRRTLFDRIGGFDEALGGGGPLKSSQDFDFQYRAYLAGATVALRPDVNVDHYGLRTAEQWPATQRAYGFGDGAFYFKHVRCGDVFALKMLTLRIVRMAVREALIKIGIRRRPSQWLYLRSCFTGILESSRFPVDRQQRMYRLLPANTH